MENVDWLPESVFYTEKEKKKPGRNSLCQLGKNSRLSIFLSSTVLQEEEKKKNELKKMKEMFEINTSNERRFPLKICFNFSHKSNLF